MKLQRKTEIWRKVTVDATVCPLFQNENGSTSVHNFIRMAKAFYNENSGFILNNINGKTGQTFWYEILPQIQFIELSRLYPDEMWMTEIILQGAENWHNAFPNFKDDTGNYNFATNTPIYGSDWNEPPNGGLAFIFYNAYLITEDEKYLDDVKIVLDYLENWN